MKFSLLSRRLSAVIVVFVLFGLVNVWDHYHPMFEFC